MSDAHDATEESVTEALKRRASVHDEMEDLAALAAAPLTKCRRLTSPNSSMKMIMTPLLTPPESSLPIDFLIPNNANLMNKASSNIRADLANCWAQFESWDDITRKIFIDGILARCDWPQLPYTSNLLKQLLKVDFLAVLPNEIAFQILSHLDASSLCRVCQVSKLWKRFGEDNQIWLRMCKQHIGHRCKTCGWGLPALALETITASLVPYKQVYAEKHIVARNWKSGSYFSQTLSGHEDGVMCVQFDDCKVVSGSYDRTIRIWDMETLTCKMVLKGHHHCVQALQYNDCMIVSGSMDKTIRIWCLKTGRFLRSLEHSDGVLCLNFDDKRIVSGTVDGVVHVWDFKTNSHYPLVGHIDRVNCVKIYQDHFVLSASDDMTICLWDVNTRECVRKFQGHTAQIQCLQASGNRMVTGSLDNTLKVWNIETGKCSKTFFGHMEGVWCLAFDSLRIVSGAHDKTLKIWDIDDLESEETSSQAVHSFLSHEGAVNCLALSESKIVTGSDDCCIKIWDFGSRC